MIHIRAMSRADLSLGMRLKDQAGWNQTEADWQRVIDLQPDGCFVAEWDGSPAGTTAAVIFGDVAWVMMVLVDEALRGRGIGTRLMQHALEYLEARRAATIRLDATPLGRPVYEKLGFQPEYELARFEHAGLELRADEGDRPTMPDQLETIVRLDRRATGTDRSRLIRRLYAEQPSNFRVVAERDEIAGYGTFRAGSRASHVGPVVATSAGAGIAVYERVISQCGRGRLFLDIPLENRPAVRWAETNGLTIQRHLTRMRKGRKIEDRRGELWASFGPEKG